MQAHCLGEKIALEGSQPTTTYNHKPQRYAVYAIKAIWLYLRLDMLNLRQWRKHTWQIHKINTTSKSNDAHFSITVLEYFTAYANAKPVFKARGRIAHTSLHDFDACC